MDSIHCTTLSMVLSMRALLRHNFVWKTFSTDQDLQLWVSWTVTDKNRPPLRAATTSQN